jgi:predicted TIM-barrel fold metal-dependent hydrolase
VPDTTFEQDDYFKIDPEAHLVGDMSLYDHYPGVQMWWRAIENIRRPLMLGAPPELLSQMHPDDLTASPDPDALLAAMDRYGVDIGCLLPESMMDTTGYSSRWVPNGEMARVVETHPDRFMYQPNISPIKQRGIDNTIWELEYWVKEKGAKIFKFYPPEDTYVNDPDLWPFYKKAEELGIVLDIHTGFSWVPPGKSKYSVPILIDDVARDFPELKIVAFHMGYPHCDDLNLVAMGHPNVYPCLSLLVPWAVTAPRKFARIIGEALRFVGPERIIWGTDYAGFGAQIAAAVGGFRDFQIPEDMQEGYGYPAITDADRRMIFGENLARLLGIDPKRRIGNR